ncbi:MAG: ABC transporter ATP-binding protein [Candidatus Marinamargulisbacteria bacterium]
MLTIRDLSVRFASKGDVIHAVSHLNLNIEKNDFIGLVGESGSGKSVSALAILKLLPTTAMVSGDVLWHNTPITRANAHQMRGQHIGMIFQNPMMAFNPVLTMGQHFIETIQHHHNTTKKDAETMAVQYLDKVHITDSHKRLQQYPHEFSLGMCQRAMIALTLCMKPSLLIADEPTASLDVTVQSQIMALLQEIHHDLGMAILFISHDLGIVAQNCNQVHIMYLGQIVEHGPTIPIFKNAHHPYTQRLIAAIPNPDPTQNQPPQFIKGEIPSPLNMPSGCRFHTRCNRVTEACKQRSPELVKQHQTTSRCILPPTN